MLDYSKRKQKEGQMIQVENILNVLELVVWSGYIKGEQPVSALVTAPVEAGKTEVILKFAQNEGCVAKRGFSGEGGRW